MSESPAHRFDAFTTRRTARCAVRGPSEGAAARELWLVLHGYGQLAADFLAGFGAVDDGTRLLVAPEGLSRFYDARSPLERHADAAVGASWMTREDREAEIADQRHWLSQVRTHYAAQVAPGAPLVVVGFSQGAAAATRWIVADGVPVSHLICWGASVAPELPVGPGSVLGGTRTTLVVGDRDRFITPDRIAMERDRLDAAGFRYAFARFEGGHRMDDATLRRLAAR